MKEYLTLKELADHVSVSINTLRNWMASGMPYIKLGRSVRVNRSDFDAWFEQFRVVGAARASRRKRALREAMNEVDA